MIGDDEPDLWRMGHTDLMMRQLLRLAHRRLIGTNYRVTVDRRWLFELGELLGNNRSAGFSVYPVRTYHYSLAWRLWRWWFRIVRRMTFHRYLIHMRQWGLG